MDMDALMPMRIDQLLTLTQWLSPAFPVGTFAYSHGLEAAVDQGWIRDAAGLEGWLKDVAEYGGGSSDALFLNAAYNAENHEALYHIDATARAFAPSKERLLETEAQGRAFCDVTAALWGDMPMLLTYPVALGFAAAREELPAAQTTQLYMQALLSNLIAAGQRLLPVGQTEGQAILKRLTPLCVRVAKAHAHGDLNHLSSTAFLTDVASMKHETQYSRIFRT
ncbi:urease accessory protein [Aliiroseovarius sediminilitoris]|uniref:Urease accessory protein UreF n=1 Tax=Aliiroseovarius sediminilitoris TaxID=1173584 RepID=A0A1I0MXB6_9RHOB|nr:urease accessory UreF family protein [Aliiroseovarius sediminilitoris]SEV93448.1 urease accessory protein [Aliiroseovarius sediminilitoris]